jgi:hypothetical protein
MRLKRFALSEANDAHRHVVFAPGSAAQQFFPLRLSAGGYLISRPAFPFQRINVLGGSLHENVSVIEVIMRL